MDSERVLSKVRVGERWDDEYSSISEFKQDLDEAEAAWEQEELQMGWVLYDRQHKQSQIINLLRYTEPDSWVMERHMMQFWAVVKVEGQNHYLETSHQPFSFRSLSKGICWYRKLCRGHVYVVDVKAADEELPGGVGRAYRNKQPESTPDLRLYSTNEYPMHDDAAGCGFRAYCAIPLYDLHKSEYYGVMEILSHDHQMTDFLFSTLKKGLESAGFKSTRDSICIGGFKKEKKPESEITEILELAMEAVPRLFLAQVWIPCQQFANMTSTKWCSMEFSSFLDSENMKVSSWDDNIDIDMYNYIDASTLHNLRIDVRTYGSKLCDVSISKNPLAHYSQRARMSYYFQVSLQSLNISNHFYIIQFFFHPKPISREDAFGDKSLLLLLRIMEMNLKTFKLALEGQLLEEILIQSRQPNAIECGSIDSLNVMNSYKENFSESDFNTYLDTVDSCCLRPSFENRSEGWAFRLPAGEILCVNDIEEKIQDFITKIAVKSGDHSRWIVQFWAPKEVKGRCYLQTLDQPYAVGCLAKGIASFRKKCVTHKYYVDDKAKDEELGPPGRVFRNGHPEFTPDLIHYATKEFSIRNYAMHCCSRGYFVLPIFAHEINHKCVGVLEFLGFRWYDLKEIGRKLKDAKLCSIHTDLYPRFLAYDQAFSTIYCRREALTELHSALEVICNNISQLHMANVWVANGECVTMCNMSCMELALSTEYSIFMPTGLVHWIHVKSRKGMVGMVLASENKSCFCQNLGEFSIIDQPLSHFDMIDRRDVCFAISLQSSHTGDLIYVVEFFLYKGPATYDYLRSFLNLLMSMMKQEFKTFKMSCGKELGGELVVEVIEFSDANKLDFSASEQTDMFPIKLKSVQYDQKEHQHTEERQTEECSDSGSDPKGRKREKRKERVHFSIEILEPHVQKTEIEAAKVFNVSLSTIKRACRNLGIDRWPGPGEEKHKKNSTLSETETATKTRNDTHPSTSNIQPLDTNTESTPHVIVQEEDAEKVIFKVKYEKDTIKFEICMSLGLTSLMEQVGMRLKLEMGSFKLKYLDEDGDEILLANDADLQFCWKTQITLMHKTLIDLFVR